MERSHWSAGTSLRMCLIAVGMAGWLCTGSLFAGENADQETDSVVNSLRMTFVRIPPGEFDFGSSRDEVGRNKHDLDRRHVVVENAFHMETTEFTSGAYFQLYGQFPPGLRPPMGGAGANGLEDSPLILDPETCLEICEHMNSLAAERAAGRRYRIPTEVEWEYACRALSKDTFTFGDSPELLKDYAWFGLKWNSRATYRAGAKQANHWGLYDMHGGLSELCWMGGLGIQPEKFVIGVENFPPLHREFVLRGGAFYSTAADCRCASRMSLAEDGTRGMRLVMELGKPDPNVTHDPTKPATDRWVSLDTMKAEMEKIQAEIAEAQKGMIVPKQDQAVARWQGIPGMTSYTFSSPQARSKHIARMKEPIVLLELAIKKREALLSGTHATENARTWKDTTGRFSLEAKWVRTEGDHVVLKTKDGREQRVAIAKLCDEDREWIANQTAR